MQEESHHLGRARRRGPAAGISLVALALLGCTTDAGGAPSGEVTRVTAATEGDLIVVDLRQLDRAWAFDPTEGALPLDRVLLFCPNGAAMQLNSWISEQETTTGVELGDRAHATFTLSARADLAGWAYDQLAATVEECDRECYYCPDGAYICASTCPNEGDAWQGTRTAPGGGDGESGEDDGSFADRQWVDRDDDRDPRPPPQYDPRDPPAPSF